ncbi:MAG: endonuclease/exonuclease/phosphatase family protein [Anaerolineae bacterium]|nr:endonuclease/exonuclease/phosphatase family protein [Anaerolineae bacterium]
MGKTVNRESVSKIFIGGALAYSGFIVVWLILRLVFADAYWVLAILNTGAMYCFAPLPFLAAPVIWSRHKGAIASLLVPVAAFFLLWGTLMIPAPATATASPSLRIMTFNVLISNTNTDKLARAIAAARPDVIGLQELSPRIAPVIRERFAEEYPYTTFDEMDTHGVGLMSRFPITAVHRFPFPPKDLALQAEIDWNGQPVQVFVVHLSANNIFNHSLKTLPQLTRERYAQRADQVTRLEDLLDAISDPVILLCDCNFTDTSEAYGRLDTRLNDSYKKPGWGAGNTLYTQGVPFRVQRVDYVWHSSHFIALRSFVGQDGGSDHRPVVSTLSFRGADK